MATSPVMAMLAHGVPLTLICDLTTTRDPESQTISLNERPPVDLLAAEAQRSESPPSTAQIWPVTYVEATSA
jgi:hypothetical protein